MSAEYGAAVKRDALRRGLAVMAVTADLFHGSAQPAPTLAAQHAADVAALDQFVRESYAFLPAKATDWSRVISTLLPRARAARDHTAWLHVLEEALDALYDGHTQLNANAPDSWRPVPYGLWVEPKDGRYVVTAVQRGSLPERTGVRPGDELVAIDRVPVAELYGSRRPHFLKQDDPAADEWALASAVAGRHNTRYELLIRRSGRESLVAPGGTPPPRDAVEWKRVGSDIGLIAISTFAPDRGVVAAFDRALEALRGARGLIIDVRSNGGGDTVIARPMIGRLIAARKQYAWMTSRDGAGLGPRRPEFVDPRGPWTWSAPVVVVVDRFSVSMAEGFAMALSGLGRARIVGTRMARLGAAVGRIELPYSKIAVQISTEPVYATDGTPRWELEPDVLVDPLRRAEGDDPFIAAALVELERSAGK
jgi:carboxyl-terminal processing protease